MSDEFYDRALPVALDNYLSEWSGDPQGALNTISSFEYSPVDHDDILVWQPFEMWAGKELAAVIESLAESVAKTLREATDEKRSESPTG